MKKENLRVLILSLIAVIALAIGISLTIIGAINISNGVKKTNDNNHKTTTPFVDIKSTTIHNDGTKISSSTGSLLTSTTTTTISPISYYPPKSGIIFGVLSGDKIKPETYEYIVQNMIPNLISSNWTHPERVGALSYNIYLSNEIVTFNQPDFNTIKKNISSFSWYPGKRNISTELDLIRQTFLHPIPVEDEYIQTILFTGTSDMEDIENSITDSMILNESGQFIIVGVGRDVNKNLLQKLSKNVLIYYYGGNDKVITNQLEEMIVNFKPNSFMTTTTTLSPTTTIINNITLSTKISTIQTTTRKPFIYYNPCFTDIILAVDTSSDTLTSSKFKNQISILTDNITVSWTHYERVALTSYNDNFNSLYTFNTIQNHNDFKSKINTFKMDKGSSLTRLLSGLLTLQTNNDRQLSIFIFISNLNYGDLQFAKAYANQLLKKGKLNFIILDDKINPYDLVSLNASKIISYNFTKESLLVVKNFFETSYSCNFVPSTPWPLTTTVIQTTTSALPSTTSSNNYYPPKSAIIFSIDSNKNINNNLYQNVKNLLTNNIITSQWTDPSRVGIFGYDSNNNTETSPFGIPTFNDIKEIVNNFNLLSGNCSTSIGLKETKLQFYASLQNNFRYMQTILFTSCSDINDINNGIIDAFFLRMMGQLIIVGFGDNVKKENLLKLTDKVIIWNGNVYDQNFINTLEGWIVNFNPNISTTPTTTTTTLFSTTTSPQPSIPYYPCPTNIILAIDASSDVMTSPQFDEQINLIQNTITTNWTHYDRVSLSWYNTLPSTFYSYNTIKNKNDFDLILSTITQESGSSLSKLLSTFLYLQNDNNFKTSIFIFISEVDIDDIENSRPFVGELLKNGFLNFITIGDSITPQEMSMLLSLNPTNIVKWDYDNSFDILRFFNQSFDC